MYVCMYVIHDIVELIPEICTGIELVVHVSGGTCLAAIGGGGAPLHGRFRAEFSHWLVDS